MEEKEKQERINKTIEEIKTARDNWIEWRTSEDFEIATTEGPKMIAVDHLFTTIDELKEEVRKQCWAELVDGKDEEYEKLLDVISEYNDDLENALSEIDELSHKAIELLLTSNISEAKKYVKECGRLAEIFYEDDTWIRAVYSIECLADELED